MSLTEQTKAKSLLCNVDHVIQKNHLENKSEMHNSKVAIKGSTFQSFKILMY